MISYHYKKTWRALLLAVFLITGAFSGKASDYSIRFGVLVKDSNILMDVTGAALWTYYTDGSVSNLSYSADSDDLSFFLEKSDNVDGSLSLTTTKTFSGTLKGITLHGNEADWLVIKAYAGQREIGELEYNGKVYAISGLSLSLRDEPITLKFMISTNMIIVDQNDLVNDQDDFVNDQDDFVNDQDDFVNDQDDLVDDQDDLINDQDDLVNDQILGEQNINNFVVANGVQVSGLTEVEIIIDDTVVPLVIDEPVTFDPDELSTADLSNYSYKGILFTLNEPEGDGFENEDGVGAIYIGSVLTDEAVGAVNNAVNEHIYSPGDRGYAVDFAGGMTLMIPKGNGIIKIEAENESDYAYHVKVGDCDPVQVASTKRKWLKVPYEVDEDTYVYIYMVEAASATRAGTRIGRRATAHGKIYVVKCAAAGSSFVMGDADGSGDVDDDDVKAIVDYIMGIPPAGFNKSQADVNGDEVVDVADLVEVICIVEKTP